LAMNVRKKEINKKLKVRNGTHIIGAVMSLSSVWYAEINILRSIIRLMAQSNANAK